jgi:hypothetical protein
MAIEHLYWGPFLALGIFAFGMGTLASGLFTAYFGAGKSRTIGFTLSVIGVIVLAFFAALTWPIVNGVPTLFLSEDVLQGLVGLIGAVVGGILALVVFLGSIMKA